MASTLGSVWTVASAATVSNDLALGTSDLAGFVIAGTPVSANFTLKGSIDGTSFYDIYDDNNTKITITIGASRCIGLRKDQASVLRKFKFLRLIMASAETNGLTVVAVQG